MVSLNDGLALTRAGATELVEFYLQVLSLCEFDVDRACSLLQQEETL